MKMRFDILYCYLSDITTHNTDVKPNSLSINQTCRLPYALYIVLSGTPDAQLNPKKKILEQILPDLRISSDGVATYKGVPWNVVGKEGLCTVPTMRDTIIK